MKATRLPSRFSALIFGLFLLGSGLFLQSCSPKYDMVAVENVTKLSASLPPLMEKAVGKYSDHEEAVQTALSDVNKAYERSFGTKKNGEIAEQWRIFRDDIAKPFFDKWKEKGKLDKDFIKEAAKQVKASLDAIEKAERAKKKK